MRNTVKIAIALALTGLCFAPLSAAEENAKHKRIAKDIQLLSKVMQASMEGDNRGRRGRRGHDDEIQIKGTYLEGQGVVLRLRRGGHLNFEFDHNFSGNLDFAMNFVIPEIPEIHFPVAPKDLSDDEREEWEEAYEEIQEQLEENMEELEEAIGDISEELSENIHISDRELRQELRSLRRTQSKEAQRARQQINRKRREMSRSEKLSQKERDTIVAEVKVYQSKLRENAKDLAARMTDLTTKQQTIWNKSSEKIEAELMETLCEYGSMRGLPANEFVTVIMEGAVRQVRGGAQDRIYVFKKADLVACRQGKMTKEQLKAKSNIYSF